MSDDRGIGDYPEPDNRANGDKVFPRQNATLTDAEREAVELAYSRLTADTHYASVAATLRGLLERMA